VRPYYTKNNVFGPSCTQAHAAATSVAYLRNLHMLMVNTRTLSAMETKSVNKVLGTKLLIDLI